MTRSRARHAASSPAALILALATMCLCHQEGAAGAGGASTTGGAPLLRVKVLDKPSEATRGVPLLVTARVSGGGGGGGDDDDGDASAVYRFSRLFNPDANLDGGASSLTVLLHYRAMFGEEKKLAGGSSSHSTSRTTDV